MTPFGEKMRALRAERSVSLKDMAESLRVSSAYLSALEHGKRGKPSWAFLQSVLNYFNLIWDDADALIRLADLSDPRVVIDTTGLSAQATLAANRLAAAISSLDENDLDLLMAVIDGKAHGKLGITPNPEMSKKDLPNRNPP